MEMKAIITLPVALVAAVFLAVSLGIISWGVQKPNSDLKKQCEDSTGPGLCLVEHQFGLVGQWQHEERKLPDGVECGDIDLKTICDNDNPSEGMSLVHCKAKCSGGKVKLITKSQLRDTGAIGYVDGNIAAAIAKENLKADVSTKYKCWRQGPGIGLIVAGLSCMVFVAALAFLAASSNHSMIHIVAIVFAVLGMIAAVLGVAFALAANNPATACKFDDKDLDKAMKKQYKESFKSEIGGAGAVGLVGAILSVFVVVLTIVGFLLTRGGSSKTSPGPA